MATRAAYNEFFRVLSDPAGFARRAAYAPVIASYQRRWSRYTNSIFEDKTFWSGYLSTHGMYRYTRPIFNPARSIGDFYASIIYPGVLATDGKRLPDGTPLAIPLADDTPDALRNALGQLWQWSNWQDGMGVMTLFGAVLGDVGVEVVDEVDRGKVTFDIIWPGLVTELELDSTGNVKAHTIEYDAEDENRQTYTYRKEVDGERIAEYKDDKLFQYDANIPAARPNPYGFDPFVWCRHRNIGNEHGAPALRNEHSIDELNSLASHAYDRSHAVLSSPILVSGAQSNSFKAASNAETKRPSASESTPTDYSGRESIRFITGGDNAKLSSIELPEGEVAEKIDQLWRSIEREHPELTMYEQLRGMSQVTGPGAEFLIGDTSNLVIRARAGYDTQSIKLFQMAIAIAGWRIQQGDWGTLSRQQQAFSSFNLESYKQGALDFEIMPRPLVPGNQLTADDKRVLMEASERGFATRAKVVEALGGNPDEDIAEIDSEQNARQDANAATVQQVMERVRGQQQQPEVQNAPQ